MVARLSRPARTAFSRPPKTDCIVKIVASAVVCLSRAAFVSGPVLEPQPRCSAVSFPASAPGLVAAFRLLSGGLSVSI